MADSVFRPVHAWHGIIANPVAGAMVTISYDTGRAVATLAAAPGARGEIAARLHADFGVEPPERIGCREARGLTLVWTGPDEWMAIATGDAKLADRLAAALGALAAVTDQSDGRALLRVMGVQARDVLAKGCPIDLHPRAFPVGAAAATVIGHIGVHLWRPADQDDAPVFALAVPRSLTGSFRSWLESAAATFGPSVVLDTIPS